jgi:hypothetical protein
MSCGCEFQRNQDLFALGLFIVHISFTIAIGKFLDDIFVELQRWCKESINRRKIVKVQIVHSRNISTENLNTLKLVLYAAHRESS